MKGDELGGLDMGITTRGSWPIAQGVAVAVCLLLLDILSGCAPTQSAVSQAGTAVVAEKTPPGRELDRRRGLRERNFASYQEKTAEAGVAERAGDLRRAVKLYTAALTYTHEPGPRQETLGRIARLVAGLIPPPAIPAEAFQQAAAGEVLLKQGQTRQDFAKATEHFAKAAQLAPWWGSIYYNLALACEAAGDPAGASRAYEAFLIVEPGTTQAAPVRARVTSLQAKAAENAVVTRWLGYWRGRFDSLLLSSIDGVVWTLKVVEPSTQAASVGWKPEDIVFQGTLQGGRVRGWTAGRGLCDSTNRPQYCKDCLGEVLWFQSVLELSSDDKKLLESVRYFWPPFPLPNGSGCIFNATGRDIWHFEYPRVSD
jgi:tetratricopeptide (TPR) repeat protein